MYSPKCISYIINIIHQVDEARNDISSNLKR